MDLLEERGDELAIADETGSFTWKEVNGRVNRLIHGLRSLGLGVGDPIAILSNNRHEFLEVNAASFHSGGVLVPVNWHLVPDEIAYILSDSGAKAIVTEPDFLETANAAVKIAGGPDVKILFSGASAAGWVDYEELLESSSPDEPEDQSGGGNMFYTSGTTGKPKGVRSTALQPGQPLDNLVATIQGLGALLGLLSDAKTLVNSPLYHAGPYAAATVASALRGAVLLRRKFDPIESLQLIQDEKIRQAYFVPTHFVRFLKLDEETKKSFDSLVTRERLAHRCTVSTGGEEADHRVVGTRAQRVLRRVRRIGLRHIRHVGGMAQEARNSGQSATDLPGAHPGREGQ